MDKNITSSSCSFNTRRQKRHLLGAHKSSPSEKTLMFLRAFARNYRASSLLPESLSGFVLG